MDILTGSAGLPYERKAAEAERERARAVSRAGELEARVEALDLGRHEAGKRDARVAALLEQQARSLRALERSRQWRLARLVRAGSRLLRPGRGGADAPGPHSIAEKLEGAAADLADERSVRKANAGARRSAGELVEQARTASSSGEWDRAAGLWRSVTDRHPDPPDTAYAGLSRALRRSERMADAERAVEAGLDRYPGSKRLHIERADIAMEAREWYRAVSRWRSVIDRFGDDLGAYPFRRLRMAMRRAEAATAAPTYSMFGGYLSQATVDPVMKAPFSPVESRTIAVMDSWRRASVRRYTSNRPGATVSVIMPTRNRLGQVEAAIASVQAQSHRQWELIVVDDAGNDGTAEYVAGLADDRIRTVVLEQHRGAAAARNVGLSEARGDLIAHLDSDNTWHPDYLLVMAGALEEAEGVSVAYCAQAILSTGPGEPEWVKAVRFGPFNRSLLENNNYIDINALVHTARAGR